MRCLAPTCTLVLWLCACTTPQATRDWEAALADAEHLMNADDYGAAREAYLDLRGWAPDASDERYVTYCLGLIEERRGRYDSAREYYMSLLEHHDIYTEEDEYTARGIYRLGRISYDNLSDPEEGLQLWWHVIRYFPEAEGPAHRALDGIVVHYEQVDRPEEAAAAFAQAFESLEQTVMGDNMLYWLAYWHRHYLGNRELALQLFLRLREQYYESSGLRDEAEWQILEIYHEQGDFEREVALMDEMRWERRDTIILGPYVTGSIEQAAYRIGLVRLENLNDPEGAIEEWQLFLDTYRYSLERDDAMYGIVRATAALGDRARTRRAAEVFLRDFYESRWVDEVRDIVAQLDGEGRP